jgi:MFS transporter, AAHS family, 4-hydroxybenzoate transporter
MFLVRKPGLGGPGSHYRTPLALLMVSFGLVMIDGYDMFIVSFVAPLIAKDLHLASVSIGLVFAAGLAGSMVGGLVLGPVADRFGRRPVLLASLILAGLATLLCSQAATLNTFAALRFATGFALGGFLAAIVPLVAEYFPAERRSAAVTFMFIGYPLGAVVGGAITALLLGHGWRMLFIGTGTVTLLLLPVALFLKETVLAQTKAVETTATMPRRLVIGELLSDGRLWPTLLASLSIFCLLLVTYLLNSWTPLIAVRSGLTPERAAMCGVTLNLGGVVGALVSTVLVRKAGVFRVVAVMIFSGACVVALLGTLYGSVGELFAGLFVIGLLVIGGQQNSPAIAVQLYPQRMRAAGAGWQFAAGRLGSIFGPVIGGHLLAANITLKLLFVIVAAPAVVAATAILIVDRLRLREQRT